MGTTHYLSIETDAMGRKAIDKLWKHIKQHDFDAPDLQWYVININHANETEICRNLHWRKANYDVRQLTRYMSRVGATGKVSLAEWDSDIKPADKAGACPNHIPKPIWRGFTASAKHNRF